MPVIINDFEITPAPPPVQAKQLESTSDQKQEKPMPIRHEDIKRIQQHLQSRHARVWAE